MLTTLAHHLPASRIIAAALLLTACDAPSTADCLPGRDVSDWVFTERSPQSTTTPVISCGRVVGWDIAMPDGDHPSTIWGAEKGSGGIVGEKVSFSVDIEASGPAAESLRVSIDSALRVEIGSAEAKPAFRSRVEVPARVSPTSGVIRSVQLGLPLSGAGMWRLSNFEF